MVYAPTDKGRCYVCKKFVEEGEIKIGYIRYYDDKPHMKWKTWKHLICFSLAKSYKDLVPNSIKGYYDLRVKDRKNIHKLFDLERGKMKKI